MASDPVDFVNIYVHNICIIACIAIHAYVYITNTIKNMDFGESEHYRWVIWIFLNKKHIHCHSYVIV